MCLNRMFKIIEISFFGNIINVFTVTFDQCNASLMNKSISVLFNLTYTKLLNGTIIVIS